MNIANNQNPVLENELTQNKVSEISSDPSMENISMENASYLQNLEETDPKAEEHLNTFEVDSIELATPELFSDNIENNFANKTKDSDLEQMQEPKIFENTISNKEDEIKEPEMFKESNSEEDFEIPAFLRRQKN